jgi:hypothetical protein
MESQKGSKDPDQLIFSAAGGIRDYAIFGDMTGCGAGIENMAL